MDVIEKFNCEYVQEEVKVKKMDSLKGNYFIYIKGKDYKGVIHSIPYRCDSQFANELKKGRKYTLLLFADCFKEDVLSEDFITDKIRVEKGVYYQWKKPKIYFTSSQICKNYYQDTLYNVKELKESRIPNSSVDSVSLQILNENMR